MSKKKKLTKEEVDEFVRDLIENTEKYKKQWDDEARKEYPEMTEEQLQATWDQLAHQFGL